MAKPGINLDVTANTREAQARIKDVSKALDEVGDSLDEVAKDGEGSAEKLESGFREMARAIERDGKLAGDGLEKNISRGARDAGEAVREVKQEALQNASEVFSSFDGSAKSLVDGIQGTFGGLVAGLGAQYASFIPLAIAGAAGVGIITSALERGDAEAQQFRARVGQLAADLIAAGKEGGASLDYIVDRLKEAAQQSDPAADGLARLRDIAQRSTFDYRDLAQAYAGNADGLDALIEKRLAEVRALEDEAAAIDVTTAAGSKRYGELQNQLGAADQYLTYLEQAKTANEEAAEAEANWIAAGGPDLERKAQQIKQINDGYDETATSFEDYLNKETGLFDTKKYVEAMQRREQALRDYQDSLTSSGLSPEAQQFLEQQGVDAASRLLAGYKSADADTRAELDRIWTEAGKSNSGVYTDTFQQNLTGAPLAPPKIAYDPTSDAATYRSRLEAAFRQEPVDVRVRMVNRYGEEVG